MAMLKNIKSDNPSHDLGSFDYMYDNFDDFLTQQMNSETSLNLTETLNISCPSSDCQFNTTTPEDVFYEMDRYIEDPQSIQMPQLAQRQRHEQLAEPRVVSSEQYFRNFNRPQVKSDVDSHGSDIHNSNQILLPRYSASESDISVLNNFNNHFEFNIDRVNGGFIELKEKYYAPKSLNLKDSSDSDYALPPGSIILQDDDLKVSNVGALNIDSKCYDNPASVHRAVKKTILLEWNKSNIIPEGHNLKSHRKRENGNLDWKPLSVFTAYTNIKVMDAQALENIPQSSCFGKINMREKRAWARGPNKKQKFYYQ